MALSILFAAMPTKTRGQVTSYSGPVETARLEFQLPWKGPGAALLNPANMAESPMVYIHGSRFSSVSGKSVYPVLQASAGLPWGVSAGLAGHWTSNKIDNTLSAYTESRYAPMLAVSWPPSQGDGHRLALGLALPIQTFNAFNVKEESMTSMDMGLLWISPSLSYGRLRAGAAIIRMLEPEVPLIMDATYELSREIDLSLTWTSPGEKLEIHAMHVFFPGNSEPYVSDDENAAMNKTWGVEFRPIPRLGLKLERPRAGGLLSIGANGRLPYMDGRDITLETNLAHGRIHPGNMVFLFGEKSDEGLGLIWSIGLSLGY